MHWLAALILLAQLSTLIGPQFALPLSVRPDAPAGIRATLAGPTITDLKPEYKFGQTIDFHAEAQPAQSVSELWVAVTPEGQQTSLQKMKLSAPQPTATSEGNGSSGSSTSSEPPASDVVEATASVDVRQLTLSPFSKITYAYKAVLADKSEVQSDTFTFRYDDNRFQWQSAENGAFQAFWNGSDAALGQMILNIAQDGLRQAQDILAADPPGPIRIYAYSSSRDLQTALQLTGQPYIAGHATPELGMIMISVPSGPERKLELERQIPHEIMHILQYQVMGKQYTHQPVWLVEGMASLAELTQNPEYRRVLETTAREGTLLPVSSLCLTFPRDASGAFLAYAQSDSFVRFLHQKYGTSGLRKLIDAYQNGLGCEEGVSSALGVSLRQIEYRWQQEALGMNAGVLALDNLSPYLLLGLVVLLIPAVTFLRPARARKPTPQGSLHD